MKKSLFALAALGAFAGVAQAQSSVTLYGTLDASVQNITNGSTSGLNASGMVDSSVTSSIWGIKGTEDLGGGSKAIFNLEGDVAVTTGNLNSELFRRQAYVGLQGDMGELTLGRRTSPVYSNTLGSAIPMASLSVYANAGAAQGYAQFFMKNAVYYKTPTVAGLTGAFMYAFADNAASTGADGFNSGAYGAATLKYENGGLTLGGNYSTIQAISGSLSNNFTSTTANSDRKIWSLIANYKIGKAEVGATWTNTSANGYSANTWQAGAAYQVTPKVQVGASYTTNNISNSSLTNAQIRYTLSPRTTLYTQVNYVNNQAAADTATAAAIGGTGNYLPTWSASSINGGGAAANTVQTAVGVGVIHKF